jgi:ribosomal protein S18 acetylase RimI-like enzyme
MPIKYRPARSEDLETADRLVVSTLNDFTQRHGFGPVAVLSPPQFQLFSLNDDPAGLWIAEEAHEIVGFAWSWTCDDVWFLAQLFVSTDRQGLGIGDELIRRTFAHAQVSGATARALITFTFNCHSQGLYIRHGLVPRFPIYLLNAPVGVLSSPQRGSIFEPKYLRGEAHHLNELRNIDLATLGISRAKHHGFLMQDGASEAIGLYEGNRCVGYFYVKDGHVGPMAIENIEHVEAAFEDALAYASRSATTKVSAFIPATSGAALRIAIERRMRITLPMLLMSTREFGDWQRYFPRNPGFM